MENWISFYDSLQSRSPAALSALERLDGSRLLLMALDRSPDLLDALAATKAEEWDDLEALRGKDHEELVQLVTRLAKFAIILGDTFAGTLAAAIEAKAFEPRRVRKAQASSGAYAKRAKNPVAIAQAAAMKAIQAEWIKRKRAGKKFTATAFAKEMATKHKNIVTPEYLKNRQTEWNKEYQPAS